MRTRIAVGVAVIILVIGVSVGFLAFGMTKSQTTMTYSTYCVQTISGKLVVNVVQDRTEDPVAGAKIYGAETGGCGTFSPVITSTNGSVWFGGDTGNYSLVVDYAGHNYSFTVSLYPNSETTVSLSIPSGNFSASTYSFGSQPTRTVTRIPDSL